MLGILPIKQFAKHEREKQVLLGLVDYYIRSGKPVGSNTLKEAGFENLSSATIRNYFANLEEEGYLVQAHSSGGRIPTNLAYRLYANYFLDQPEKEAPSNLFDFLKKTESKEVARFLQESADLLSETVQCAVFLSAPRFDQDFVTDIKLVQLAGSRCLSVLLTDFGLVQTEVISLSGKLSLFSLHRIESYIHERLHGTIKNTTLSSEEEGVAKLIYNESMVRYLVGYSNFVDEDIYRTGFSKLLCYQDFKDATALSGALSLFENHQTMRLMLRECKAQERIKVWIGSDLPSYSGEANSAVLSVPYYINQKPVGAFGILGPNRLPYRTLFPILNAFSEQVSKYLTKNIYKFKINFRQPEVGHPYHLQGDKKNLMLIENQTKEQSGDASNG